MTNHTCTHCGYEIGCSHGSWHDRHPYAVVLFAVPVTITALGAIAAYPWLFVPLLTIGTTAYVVDRERRRRQALTTRADHEHAALLAAPIQPVRPLAERQTRSLPWQLVHLLRTEPLRVQRI